MAYSEKTFNDKNYFKRSLQQKRLNVPVNMISKWLYSNNRIYNILDFGCGDGELLKVLNNEFRNTLNYTGYDPREDMIEEAKLNIKESNDHILTTDKSDLKDNFYDIIFCLEVFEHLPDAMIEEELNFLKGGMKDDGCLIIGAPNEIFISALIAGLFRMTRRYGAYDANIKNILKALIGRPPEDRDKTLNEAKTYIHSHMGFDHRKLRKQIEINNSFTIERIFGSPFSAFSILFSTEVNFFCKKII